MVISSQEFNKMFLEKCVGNNACELDIGDILKGDTNQIGLTQGSTFFVQYVCGESEQIVNEKRIKLWILSSLQILTLLCFLAAIYYLKIIDIANK